jgi:hypothetical protein
MKIGTDLQEHLAKLAKDCARLVAWTSKAPDFTEAPPSVAWSLRKWRGFHPECGEKPMEKLGKFGGFDRLGRSGGIKTLVISQKMTHF